MAKKNNKDPRAAAVDFTGRLRDIYADDLLSVLLYGSTARGEHRPGVSDINLLVILRELDLSRLEQGAALTGEWLAAGNPPALMMTSAEWRNSADVFPIEYSDIRGAHEILHGEDPFPGIEIHREHLRLQLENELRSRKIQLRETIVAMVNDPKRLGMAICGSLPSFGTLFRGILRLADRPVPPSSDDLIAAVAREVEFDPDPLHQVLRRRDAGDDLSLSAGSPILRGYLEAVEKTVLWLDRYSGTSGTAVI